MVRHGEAASANQNAAEEFVQDFTDYVKANGFIPQKVFNCDETGLFWKKKNSKEDIHHRRGEIITRTQTNEGQTGNASGDFKIKPLLVYRSENPRVFEKNNVIKGKFPVMWRANSKTWVNRECFIEWIHDVFAPSVKKLLQENNLPLK